MVQIIVIRERNLISVQYPIFN